MGELVLVVVGFGGQGREPDQGGHSLDAGIDGGAPVDAGQQVAQVVQLDALLRAGVAGAGPCLRAEPGRGREGLGVVDVHGHAAQRAVFVAPIGGD